MTGAVRQAAKRPESLEHRWRTFTGRAGSPGLQGKLLDCAIAYEQQCKAHRGLSRATKRALARLIVEDQARSASLSVASSNDTTENASPSVHCATAASASPTTIRRRPRAGAGYAVGTQFVRDWDGARYTVIAVENGFAWNGKTFGSLSAVARSITGTRWNGRRFFGLDKIERAT